MSVERAERTAMLQSCLELPQLTDAERGLLREVAIAYGSQQQMPPTRAGDVMKLFMKLRKILNVP